MSVLAAYMVPHPPLIVPEVGRGGEDEIETTRTAYARAAEEIAALEPNLQMCGLVFHFHYLNFHSLPHLIAHALL